MRYNREKTAAIVLSMLCITFCGFRTSAADDLSEMNLALYVVGTLGWEDLYEHQLQRLSEHGEPAALIVEARTMHWKALNTQVTQDDKTKLLEKAKQKYDEYLAQYPDRNAAVAVRTARADIDLEAARAKVRLAEELEAKDPEDPQAKRLREDAVNIFEGLAKKFREQSDAVIDKHKDYLDKIRTAIDHDGKLSKEDQEKAAVVMNEVGKAVQAYADKILELIEAAGKDDPRKKSYAEETKQYAEKLDEMLNFAPAFGMYMGLVRGRATGMLGPKELDAALEIFDEVWADDPQSDFERQIQKLAYYHAVKICNLDGEYGKAIEKYEMALYSFTKMKNEPLGMAMALEAADAYFKRPAKNPDDPSSKEKDYIKAIALVIGVANQTEERSKGLCYKAQKTLARMLLDAPEEVSLPTTAFYSAAEGMFSLAKETQRKYDQAQRENDAEAEKRFHEKMLKLYQEANKFYTEAIYGTRRETASLEERVKIEPQSWLKMGECYYQLGMYYEAALAWKMCAGLFSVDKLSSLARTRTDLDFANIAKLNEEQAAALPESRRREAHRVKTLIDKMNWVIGVCAKNAKAALSKRSRRTKKPWDILLYNEEASVFKEAGETSGGSREYESARTFRQLATAFLNIARDAEGDERKDNYVQAVVFLQKAINDYLKVKNEMRPNGIFMAAICNSTLMRIYRDTQWDDIAVAVSSEDLSTLSLRGKAVREEAARRGEESKKLLEQSITVARELLAKADYPTEKKLMLRKMVNQAKKQIAQVFIKTGRTIMDSAGNDEAQLDKARARFEEGLAYAVKIQKEWETANPEYVQKLTTEIPNAWYDIYTARYYMARALFEKTRLNLTPESLAALRAELEALSLIADVTTEERMDDLYIAGKNNKVFLLPKLEGLVTEDFVRRRLEHLIYAERAIIALKDGQDLAQLLKKHKENERSKRDLETLVKGWWENLDEQGKNSVLAFYRDPTRFGSENVKRQYRKYIRVISSQMDSFWTNYMVLATDLARREGGSDNARVAALRGEYGYREANRYAGRFAFWRVQNYDEPSTGQLLNAQSKCEMGGNGAMELVIIKYILNRKDPDHDNKAMPDELLQEIFYEMFAGKRPLTGHDPIIRLARYRGSDKDRQREKALIQHAQIADLMLDDVEHGEYVDGEFHGAGVLNKELDDPNLKYDGSERVDYEKAMRKIAEIRAYFTDTDPDTGKRLRRKFMVGGKSVLETLTVKRKGSDEVYLDIVEAEAQFRVDIQRIRDRYLELLILQLVKQEKSEVDIKTLKEMATNVNTQILGNPSNLKYQIELIQTYWIMGRQPAEKLEPLNQGTTPDDLFPEGKMTKDKHGKRYPVFMAMDIMKAGYYGNPDELTDEQKKQAKQWLKRPTKAKHPSLNVFTVAVTPINCLRYANLVCAQIRKSIGRNQIVYNEENGNFRIMNKGEEPVFGPNEIDLKFWTGRIQMRLYMDLAELEPDEETRRIYLDNAKNYIRSVVVVFDANIAEIEKSWPNFKTARKDGSLSDVDRLIALMDKYGVKGGEELLNIPEVQFSGINYRTPDRYEQLYITRKDQRDGIGPDSGAFDKKIWTDAVEKEFKTLKEYADISSLILDHPKKWKALSEEERKKKEARRKELHKIIKDNYDPVERKRRAREQEKKKQ